MTLSTAIPFYRFMESFTDEKLITLEVESYNNFVDFTKLYSDKLNAGEITDFLAPMYLRYQWNLSHAHNTITDIMYKRKLPIPQRQVAEYMLNLHDLLIEKGFKWDVVTALD